MRAMLILILSVSCSYFSAAAVCELDAPFNFRNGDKLSLTTNITDGTHLGTTGTIYFNNNHGLNLFWTVTKGSTKIITSLAHRGYFDTRADLSALSYLSITFEYQSKNNNLIISLSTKTRTLAIYIGSAKISNLRVFSVTWKNVPFTCERAGASRTTAKTTASTKTSRATTAATATAKPTATRSSTTASSCTEKQAKGVGWRAEAVAAGCLGGLLLILDIILAALLYKSRRSMQSKTFEEHEEEAVYDSIAPPSTVGREEEYHIYEEVHLYANIGLNCLPQIHGHQLALPQ